VFSLRQFVQLRSLIENREHSGFPHDGSEKSWRCEPLVTTSTLAFWIDGTHTRLLATLIAIAVSLDKSLYPRYGTSLLGSI
jgi:hypothetical protein